ncbi:hypothetical protein GLS40_03670 [Pseudooceanicola sp. 216_PA32_1]|uniref:C-type lysozyme inhibitor domain-containing protein n=1 Tax=Pseudooceanicola pacificus TaxID=2676438 RepID=A0A844W1Z4_9RHOB|nr:MliC family protein [Pseudooceanicola pacificus]MWB77115.1 hypothetical protein [Pseudooceanicola pacificus]
MIRAPAAAATALLAATPLAAQDVIEVTYVCERGVEIPVVYIEGEASTAVLLAEGRMVVLPRAVSGSGARYARDGDAEGYVWWNKGDEATLAWFDARLGEEVTLYAFCEETGD